MFTLNKIIYYLLRIVFIQLSLLGLYFIVDNYLKVQEVSSHKSLNTELVTLAEVKPQVKEVKTKVEKKVMVPLAKPTPVNSLETLLLRVAPNSVQDIVEVKSEKVKPVIYTNSINLSNLSIDDKKKAFINMLIPSILVAKHRLSKDQEQVGKLLKLKNLTQKEQLWLTKKRHIFKASTIDELYAKMEVHPTSIVIAQAIIESGWGTSRFFKKANNVFGIWSFNGHEKRIAASEKRGKETVYLKKYSSMEQSIYDYFLMLSTKDVYEEFREVRLTNKDPFLLVEKLEKYSELGDVYIQNLKKTIEKNKLLVYDSYCLDI